MATATYRVRIAAAGATTMGTPDLTLELAYIAGVPVISGPSVDILAGRSTSHPFSVQCLVDTVLFTSSDRLTELGRLIDVQRNLDGAGYSTLATGRISHVSEIERGLVTLEVSDEGWVERGSEIFRTTDTMQLHPPGLASAWMDEAAAGTVTYTVNEVDGDAVRLGPTDEKGYSQRYRVPAGLRESLATDLVAPEDQDNSASNSSGNFTSLRFDLVTGDPATGDHEVIGFRHNLGTISGGTTSFGLLNEFAPDGSGLLEDAWVYISGHALSATDTITGRFYWPSGVALNERVPLHIGGAAGVHVGVLAQDILDGDYGGQATNYDSTAMTAFKALPLRPVWARIDGSVRRSEWLSDNIIRAFAAAKLTGTDLALRLKALRLPLNVDPGTLETIAASDANGVTWHHTSRELVTVVDYTCRAVRRLPTVALSPDERPADGFELLKVRVPEVEHDNTSTLGVHRHTIDTELILDLPSRWSGEVDRIVREVAREVFDVFGDGAQLGELTVGDDSTIEVGDFVVLDHDTLKGYNPGTAGRTGDRVVLLTEAISQTPASKTFAYLDMGPSSSPLSAPTVVVAQDTDPDLVNVTISTLSAGETATVECTAAASSPSAYDFVRSGVGNETVTFRLNAGSGNAYARAYATKPNRIRSAYGTDSVALSSRPRVDAAGVEIANYVATIKWSVPSGTLGMRTRYSQHRRGTNPTFGNQADYDVDDGGFTIEGISPLVMVTVELTPYTGWTGSAVSGSAGDISYIRAFIHNENVNLRPTRQVFHADTSARDSTSTSPTDMETVTIPAGMIGLSGALRLSATFKPTGTNAAKSAWMTFGAQTMNSVSWGSGDEDRVELEVVLTNANDESSQYVSSRVFTDSTSITTKPAGATLSIDTTADVDVTFVGDLTSGSDSIRLEESRIVHLGTS